MGIQTRTSAVALILVQLFFLPGRILHEPLALSSGAWALLPFAFAPQRPFLSYDARESADPRGDFHLGRAWHEGLRWVLCVLIVAECLDHMGARGSGLDRRLLPWSMSPVAFSLVRIAAVIAFLFPLTRRYAWVVLFLAEVLLVAGPLEVALGRSVLLVLMADPAWIPPRRRVGEERVYFDSGCGLCHGAVRFVLAEERDDRAVFAPLDGSTFQGERIPVGLPTRETILLRSGDGSWCARSGAILRLMDGLGGVWRVFAWILWLVPRPLGDLAYRGVAAVRHRFFERPVSACPLTPPGMAHRFLP